MGLKKGETNKGSFKRGSSPWNKGRKNQIRSVCLECGNEIYDWKIRSTCSLKCKIKYVHKKRKEKNWKHTEETKTHLSKVRKGFNNYAMIKRWRENGGVVWNKGLEWIQMRGENSPNWKGGISRDKHSLYEPKYKKWRSDVLKRDNWKCRIGDENCRGMLQVHHILRWSEFPELRYKINNGIALCQAHHPRKRAEEKRLASYFQELASVSK